MTVLPSARNRARSFQRTAAMIVDTRVDSRWVATTVYQQMVRSVAAVPIIREDRVLGVITLGTGRTTVLQGVVHLVADSLWDPRAALA